MNASWLPHALTLGAVLLAGCSCEEHAASGSQVARDRVQEVRLSDGTHCVAIGDKSIVCDFSRSVEGD